MHALSAISLVALMLALLPLGLTGMGLALSLSSVLVALYALRGAGDVLGLPARRLVDEVWPAAVAAGIVAAGLFALEHGVTHSDTHGVAVGLALLAAEAVVGIAVYVALLVAFRPERRGELRDLTALALTRGETRLRAS
jgi:PST family polysaccharide transporter